MEIGGDDSGRSLTYKILIGMAAGLVLGLAMNSIGVDGFVEEFVIGGLLHVGGSVFLASLKLLVVPLVFVSLVVGTAALDDLTKLGRVGAKTVVLYLTTTAIAISLALMAAVVFAPGAGFDLETDATFVAKEAPPLSQVFIDLFPSNPIRAMADGNMLQIIVFAGLFGLAITLAGEPGKRLMKIFEDANAVIMRLVMLLMWFAPYGVFCLISKVFAEQGFANAQPISSALPAEKDTN